MNLFSDLTPTTATAAPSPVHPLLADYAGQPGAFHNAMLAYRAAQTGGTPGGTPSPATAPPPAAGGTPPAPATATPPAAASPASASTAALNSFANSAGMQFQQQQAANALNNLYAARGEIESGAAMKEIPSYLQQEALQNYFMPYMSLLGGQQSVGAGAASSIAGVGSSFGNTAANINANLASGTTGILNGMGAAVGNGADAASNAAIARGAAGATLGTGIASGMGTLGSSFFAPSTQMPSTNFFAPMSTTLGTPTPLSSMPGGFF